MKDYAQEVSLQTPIPKLISQIENAEFKANNIGPKQRLLHVGPQKMGYGGRRSIKPSSARDSGTFPKNI